MRARPQEPLPRLLLTLPRCLVAAQAGVGVYLRSGPDGEWEAPVLARLPWQFPSTTRNVTYGEVLCEMMCVAFRGSALLTCIRHACMRMYV